MPMDLGGYGGLVEQPCAEEAFWLLCLPWPRHSVLGGYGLICTMDQPLPPCMHIEDRHIFLDRLSLMRTSCCYG